MTALIRRQPLHPPSLVVPPPVDLLKAADHPASVRAEGEKLRLEQVGYRPLRGCAELGYAVHGHDAHLTAHVLACDRVHPHGAGDGRGWVIVPALLAEIVGSDDGTKHDSAAIYRVYIQYIAETQNSAVLPRQT